MFHILLLSNENLLRSFLYLRYWMMNPVLHLFFVSFSGFRWLGRGALVSLISCSDGPEWLLPQSDAASCPTAPPLMVFKTQLLEVNTRINGKHWAVLKLLLQDLKLSFQTQSGLHKLLKNTSESSFYCSGEVRKPESVPSRVKTCCSQVSLKQTSQEYSRLCPNETNIWILNSVVWTCDFWGPYVMWWFTRTYRRSSALTQLFILHHIFGSATF